MGVPYRLDSCVWEITLACCFSCAYCGSRAGKARADELSTEECLDVARQLADLGCQRVSLIGGEIFLRKDWVQIAQALTSRNVDVAIITNGFLFTEEHIRKLKEARIESVAVSIDGPGRLHDKYRQEGSFDRALRAIEVLSSAGILVSVITTLNAENALTLEDLYETLRTRRIFAWQIQACSPMGNAASTGIDYRFDFQRVIGFVRDHAGAAPFKIGIADNIGYFTEEETLVRGGSAVFPGCGAGLSGIGIDSVGNVRGCESMYDARFIEGNLRSRTLADIWNDPQAFSYNRAFDPTKLTGACASCPYGSRCAAGCRSYNYFVHDKLYESPFCARKGAVKKADSEKKVN